MSVQIKKYPVSKSGNDYQNANNFFSVWVSNHSLKFAACDDIIPVVDPIRQIQASFTFSWDDLYFPANVMSENITWAAPIR
jgi:hypothetical protein